MNLRLKEIYKMIHKYKQAKIKYNQLQSLQYRINFEAVVVKI